MLDRHIAIPEFRGFFYDDGLVYSKDLSCEDTTTLKGCMCIGACESGPTSRCSCSRRQNLYWAVMGSKIRGFNYDKDGSVRDVEFPIFECNGTCGCNCNCPNRVSSFHSTSSFIINASVLRLSRRVDALQSRSLRRLERAWVWPCPYPNAIIVPNTDNT